MLKQKTRGGRATSLDWGGNDSQPGTGDSVLSSMRGTGTLEQVLARGVQRLCWGFLLLVYYPSFHETPCRLTVAGLGRIF